MPRAALTNEQIEEFRDAAVRAATRLFAERGYEGVSMRALAVELGVSAMTPYRYFANKEDLFAAVRTEGFRRFADRQAEAFAAAPAGRRTAGLGRAYAAFAIDEPEAYRTMFELWQGPTSNYPALEEQQRRAMSYLIEAVKEAIDRGSMKGDPLTVAHLLWAQLHGLVSLHLAGKLMMGRTFEQLCNTPTIFGEGEGEGEGEGGGAGRRGRGRGSDAPQGSNG